MQVFLYNFRKRTLAKGVNMPSWRSWASKTLKIHFRISIAIQLYTDELHNETMIYKIKRV